MARIRTEQATRWVAPEQMASDAIERAPAAATGHAVDLCAEAPPEWERKCGKGTARRLVAETGAKPTDLRVYAGDGR